MIRKESSAWKLVAKIIGSGRGLLTRSEPVFHGLKCGICGVIYDLHEAGTISTKLLNLMYARVQAHLETQGGIERVSQIGGHTFRSHEWFDEPGVRDTRVLAALMLSLEAEDEEWAAQKLMLAPIQGQTINTVIIDEVIAS